MKELLSVLAVVSIALGVVGAAVRLGDRQTLVSPPEAVVENFAREISERRYELAIRYLSAGVARSVDAAVLRRRFEPDLLELGETNNVASVPGWIAGERASAGAAIEAQAGVARLSVGLIREHGLWVIEELPEELTVSHPRAH